MPYDVKTYYSEPATGAKLYESNLPHRTIERSHEDDPARADHVEARKQEARDGE